MLEYAGKSERHSVNLIKESAVSKFRVKELVLNIFFLSSTCGLILVKTGGGDGVINGKLQQIFSISFFRDLIVS